MTASTINEPKISSQRFATAALMVIVLTPLVNALLYGVTSALGIMRESVLVAPMNLPITLVPVVMASLMGAMVASVVYAALLRWTQQPNRIFFVIALVVLIIAALPTITLGAPVEMILALNLMHLVAAIIIVGILTRSNRP